MKTLVLTAESSYARFRCPYTTTSALTFLTVHPVAVKGMIGAVLGIDYKELYESTKDMNVAIQVMNPVNKDTQGFNLIAWVGNNGASNFQSRVQFLRDVKYRLFITWSEHQLDALNHALTSNEYVFTPYLGCSEHVAKLRLEGTLEGNKSSEKYVDTVIPKKYVSMEDDVNSQIYFDRIPIKNSEGREYIEYSNVVFTVNRRLKTNDGEIIKVGDYNVFFF